MKTIEERPVEPYSFETDREEQWYSVGKWDGLTEQRAIDNKRTEELLQYLEELEAHYRDLEQYDDGKPIRRVIEYIKAMEK